MDVLFFSIVTAGLVISGSKHNTCPARLWTSQKTRVTEPLLVHCWSTVYDAGPRINHASKSRVWSDSVCVRGGGGGGGGVVAARAVRSQGVQQEGRVRGTPLVRVIPARHVPRPRRGDREAGGGQRILMPLM